jgi:hypothetical protein
MSKSVRPLSRDARSLRACGQISGSASLALALLVLGAACGGSTFTPAAISDASTPDSGSSGSANGGHTGGSGGSGGGSDGTGGTDGTGGSSGGTSSGSNGGGSNGGASSGAASSGNGSGASSTSSGGASSGTSSGVIDAGTDCATLLANVNASRPAAKQCCPSCNRLPCNYTVDDLCCPLTVDVPGSQSVVAFQSAVAAFKMAGCVSLCPAIACRVGPTGVCDMSTSLCE